jgi:choline dehydrogenase-like flavoprotein
VVRKVTGDGRRATVTVIDSVSGNALEFAARVVFLCASALESTRILMLSRLGGSSGELGHNLMDHVFMAGARGTIPGHEQEQSFGNRPNGIYVARFRNVKTKHPGFLRGYGCQGSADRAGWGRGGPGYGAEWKRALIKERGPWTFWLGGWGECLPRHDNAVSLDPEVKDSWGIPAPHPLYLDRTSWRWWRHADSLRRDPRSGRCHQREPVQ